MKIATLKGLSFIMMQIFSYKLILKLITITLEMREQHRLGINSMQ